jgi:putative transposase
MRIKEIAAVRPSWGSPQIHVLLRREDWLVNHKRTERLYRQNGLNLRRDRPRRRKSVVTRGPVVVPTRRDERLSMNFMHDPLQDGRRLRVLTVVDQYTPEALATEARGSFSAHEVIDVLNRLSRSLRKPAVIRVDNGTELASRALVAWAYREDVRLDFSRPGKPTDDAHIESLDARLSAECLNAHVFESLEDAEEPLTSWRRSYNAVRSHSALGMLTPKEFAELGQRNAGRWPGFLAARVASRRGEDHHGWYRSR